MLCCAHGIELIVTRISFRPIILCLKRPKIHHVGVRLMKLEPDTGYSVVLNQTAPLPPADPHSAALRRPLAVKGPTENDFRCLRQCLVMESGLVWKLQQSCPSFHGMELLE